MWRSTSSYAATCVLKTVSGGWCTSRRFHERVILPCIFGCGGQEDRIEHYVECAELWKFVQVHFPDAYYGWNGSGWAPGSLSRRLAVTRPTKEQVYSCAFAFAVYHALKIGNKDRVTRNAKRGQLRDTQDTLELGTNLARHLKMCVKHGITENPGGRGVVSGE